MPISPEIFAERMRTMRPSTIREILKVTAQPEIISFAGGLPAPELFPVAEVSAAAASVLAKNGPESLQYGPSEGYALLREWIADEVRSRGVKNVKPTDVLVTNGSQQVLDLVGKIFLNPGDVVLTENPTYLAAIQAFQTLQAKFVPVPTDEFGLVPEAIPELIKLHQPKFLYTIPTFQNPTGITLIKERRAKLAQIAAQHNLLIIEDDPYGKLRYRGEEVPPIKHWDEANCVLYVSTFSKTIAPGLRLGWVVAPEAIFSQLLIVKQASDLHTSSFDQRVAYAYLTQNDQTAHLNKIRSAYGERFDVMDAALKAEMPAGYTWTKPEGGMFLWVTGPKELDGMALLKRAIEQKVAFVPGRDFFPSDAGANYLRLNYSNSTPARIREGVKRLAALCRG
ncbi:PLP-dependent aminotransferase family protein [Oleiharenicola lentus]|uniref:aminotransferase-like domain-containing protein n=1 Tax=Oleiharenicola lentus TaxID=2508720 RepID=UPI003F666679